MSARKPSKSEKLAKRKAKELAAKRSKRDLLTPIDIWAAEIVEVYDALVRAGYGKDKARWYIEEQMRLPDWIVSNPNFTPYGDDEEDEDE